MDNTILKTQAGLREHADSSYHALVNWKSILAGLFIAFTFYVMLSALGAVFVGTAVNNTSPGSAGGIATGAIIWMAITTLIALAAGSYFAARTSTFITGRIGAAQGLVIAALFFSLSVLTSATAVTIGGLSLGGLASALDGRNANLASVPVIQDTVGKALTNVKLKSDLSTVTQGLTVRLLRREVNSAKNYLAYQSDLTAAQVDSRINGIENDFNSALQNVTTKAAQATSAAGLSVFIVMLFGVFTAITGGSMGARLNQSSPLSDEFGLGTPNLSPQSASV